MRGKKGFSLAELLVALGVFSLIMLLVGMILIRGEESTRVTGGKMQLEESVRESLYRMSLEIRESTTSRVAILEGGGAVTFQIPASVSNSGAITWSSPITYQIGGNGTQLIRLDGGTGATTVLANDIQDLTFAWDGSFPGSLDFSVTAQRTLVNGRILSVALAGEARVRNA